MLDTPESFAKEVNKIGLGFISKYMQTKIKKSTIIKCREEGGSNMTDFTVFDKTSVDPDESTKTGTHGHDSRPAHNLLRKLF